MLRNETEVAMIGDTLVHLRPQLLVDMGALRSRCYTGAGHVADWAGVWTGLRLCCPDTLCDAHLYVNNVCLFTWYSTAAIDLTADEGSIGVALQEISQPVWLRVCFAGNTPLEHRKYRLTYRRETPSERDSRLQATLHNLATLVAFEVPDAYISTLQRFMTW